MDRAVRNIIVTVVLVTVWLWHLSFKSIFRGPGIMSFEQKRSSPSFWDNFIFKKEKEREPEWNWKLPTLRIQPPHRTWPGTMRGGCLQAKINLNTLILKIFQINPPYKTYGFVFLHKQRSTQIYFSTVFIIIRELLKVVEDLIEEIISFQFFFCFLLLSLLWFCFFCFLFLHFLFCFFVGMLTFVCLLAWFCLSFSFAFFSFLSY